MKVKILAGEYLFSEQGVHICNDLGFATKADADVEVEVSDEKVDHVKTLLAIDRLNRGLDAEGNAPVLIEEVKDELFVPAIEEVKDESISSIEEIN